MTADPAVIAVIKETVSTGLDRLMRDCIHLGTPPPRFTVVVVGEPDEHLPDWVKRHLHKMDPASVYAVVNVPPDRSAALVRCTRDRSAEELSAHVAEELQQLLIEGALWGMAWPPCPVHLVHPLWPDLIGGRAVWCCPTEPPAFSAPIGDLKSTA